MPLYQESDLKTKGERPTEGKGTLPAHTPFKNLISPLNASTEGGKERERRREGGMEGGREEREREEFLGKEFLRFLVF